MALFALVFGVLHFSVKSQKFSGWVGLAYVAAFIAYMLASTRTPSTPMGLIFLSTGMFWIFSLAISRAIYIRCNATFPVKLVGFGLAIAAVYLIWLSFVAPDIYARTLLVNGGAGLLLSLSLWPLWKAGTKLIDGALFGVVATVAATFVIRVVAINIVLGHPLTEQSYTESTYVWLFQLTNGIAALALAIVLLVAAGHDMVLHFHAQSHRDPLTDLLNRRGLKGLFAARTDEKQGAIFVRTIILFDIDHFKQINDQYGHAVGDKVLQRIADTAMDLCQEYGQVARTGGEEFAVLTKWMPVETAQFLAQNICDSLRFVVHPELDSNHQVTASFGLAILSDTDSLHAGMDRADKALYHAKQNGRNQVALAKAA
ncbi:GGDEF domain-containing protein [uncultured Parasphingorhabdus sp.]|uniref:GGDEF domain-containing protein n=1 Tax=uncultured Parasphingorhabdus sp. TaxID=2709694 RepID=UPI0030DCC94A